MNTEMAVNDLQEEELVREQGMHQVWMLAISLSILQVGFGIVTPIFPYYIVELGVGGTELGMLAASFAITRIVLAGPLGGLSDKTGRRPVLLGSMIGFAIANVIYAVASNVIVMILARALEGAVSAGFFPAANAFVSDVTVPENRGTAMSYLSAGNMVGFIVGPLIGGVLAQFLGIRLPFIIAALGTMATFLAIFVLTTEPERHESKNSDMPKISVREVVTKNTKAYSALGFAMFANMFAIGILEVAVVLDAVERFGITPLGIGMFFGALGLVMIVSNVIFGKMSDASGRKWLIVAGSIVGTVSLLYFIISGDTIDFVIAGSVLAIGMSMRGPTIQALIADLTDPEHYGSIMGMFGAISNGAYAVSPLIGGILYDQYHTSNEGLIVAATVSLAGAIVSAIGLPSYVPGKMGPKELETSESEGVDDQ